MEAKPRYPAPSRQSFVVAVILATALVASAVRAGPSAMSSPMPRDPHTATKYAWEPAIANGPDGSVWIAANRCVVLDREGLCNGTPDASAAAPVWRSSDGGRRYSFVGDALRAVAQQGASVARPGGAAVDIAVAQLPRGGTPALVYVLSSTMSSSMLAVSANNGLTWRVAQLPDITLRDRPTIASSMSCDVFLAARATPQAGAASLTRVERYDGCQIFDQSQAVARPQTVAVADVASDPAASGTRRVADIVVARGIIYVASMVCTTLSSPACDAASDRETVRVAISRNRGVSFAETTLPAVTLRAPLAGAVAPLDIAADDLGNVVVAAWDGSHVRMWRSRNDGATWALSRVVLDTPLRWKFATAPAVAVHGKQVAVSWFGSPKTRSSVQNWYPVVARSIDGGARFTYTTFTTVPLARSAAQQQLGDQLREGIAATIARTGSIALAYTQSCDGRPTSDTSCPPSADENVADQVVRYAWMPRPA